VSSKEIKQGQGYGITYTPEKESEKSAAKAGRGSSDSKKDKLYLSVVKVRRLGQFQFPVEIEMVFANGDKVREKWDGKDTWTEFKYVKPVKLVSATVDPDHKVVLDMNWKNNKRTVKQAGGGTGRGYLQMIKFALNPK
jgi:hypothetical protein